MKNQIKFIIIFSVIGLFFTFTNALAVDPRLLKLNVPVGELTKFDAPIVGECSNPLNPANECVQIPWIAQYIGAWFKYAVVVGSMFAVMMIIVGGVMYVLAGASPSLVGRAKALMWSSIFGLVILVGSYLILSAVNPALTSLPSIEVERIKPEVINVESNTDKFCEELDASAYKVNGLTKDSQCGQEFTAESTAVSASGTSESFKCVSNKCTGLKQCTLWEGTYTCLRSLFWGRIKDSTARYIDVIGVVGIKGGKIDELSDTYFYPSKDKKTYYIPYSNKLAKKINEYGQVALHVQLNDTGEEKAQLTAEAMGLKGPAATIGTAVGMMIMPTADDWYYVGRSDASPYKIGDKHYVGLWFDYCPNKDGAMVPFTALPTDTNGDLKLGEDKWLYSAGVAFLSSAHILSDAGLQVDIDARYFREDSKIDCRFSRYMSSPPAVNGNACLASQAGKDENGLRCVLSGRGSTWSTLNGANNYAWTDRQLGSYCANAAPFAGGFSSNDINNPLCLSGVCQFLKGSYSDLRECLQDREACTGTCVNVATMKTALGDYCESSAQCTRDDKGNILTCDNKMCLYETGGWGRSCKDSKQCDSSKGFFCSTNTYHACIKAKAAEFQACEPNVVDSACAPGLVCTRTHMYGTRADGCSMDPPSSSKDYSQYKCLSPTAKLCYCQTSADCTSPEVCFEGNGHYCRELKTGDTCYQNSSSSSPDLSEWLCTNHIINLVDKGNLTP